MARIQTHRAPTHPGEMLPDEFLVPMNIGQRGVSPSTALRLARFSSVSADFWLNLRVRRDLDEAQTVEQEKA